MDPAANSHGLDNAALAREFELPFDDLSPTERSMLLRSLELGIRPYQDEPVRCGPATSERRVVARGVAAPANPPRRMNKERGPSNSNRRSNEHNPRDSFPDSNSSNLPFSHQQASTGRACPLCQQETSVTCMPDKFAVSVNAWNFTPTEISVKTEGNCVIVHAKHKEKSDDNGGYVKREFTRRYVLPEDVDPLTVKCHLMPNGFLALEAPRKNVPKQPVKPIPIQVEHVPIKKIVRTPPL